MESGFISTTRFVMVKRLAYARTLNIFRICWGSRRLLLIPIRLGHENEEELESGAFWFYRSSVSFHKNQKIRKLVAGEKKNLRRAPPTERPREHLRKLAAASMIFESGPVSRW